ECCQPGRQWRRSIWRAGRSPDTIAHGAPDGKPSSNIVMLHTPFLVRFGLISTRIGRRARRARTVPVADGAEDEPGSRVERPGRATGDRDWWTWRGRPGIGRSPAGREGPAG